MSASCFFLGGEEMGAFLLLHFAEIWRLHVRGIGVCEYGYGYESEISYPRQACVLLLLLFCLYH